MTASCTDSDLYVRPELPGYKTVADLNGNNEQRRTAIVILDDGSVAHIVVDTPWVGEDLSRKTILLIHRILTEGQQHCLPRSFGLVYNEQGIVIAVRRKHVKFFDPFWRELELFPLTVRNFVRVGILLAQELHWIHMRLGMAIMDLKPHNLCFDPFDQGYIPKWIDFDHACPLGQVTGNLERREVMGTASFIAPEQLRFEPVTARTDVRALCLTLASVALGTMGFDVPDEGCSGGRTHQHQTLLRISSGIYPYEIALRDRLPASIADVLLRGIRDLPKERYATCRKLAHALRQAMRSLKKEEYYRLLAPPLSRQERIDCARRPSTS